MNRRTFLYAGVASALALPLAFRVGARSKVISMDDIELMQSSWQDLLPPEHGLDFSLDPIEREPSEWRSLLSPAAFEVLRKEGTERAGSHPYNIEKRDGVFLCAGCDLPLFTSAMKYDSGTGWPSFFAHIPGHMGTKKDFKLIWPRTEYHCIRCGGHQGHVFDDGPPPTGQRWCNNGVALRFVPRDS